MKLRTVLLANAASCLLFGLYFALQPSAVAEYLGADFSGAGRNAAGFGDAAAIIRIVGIVLSVNGLHLLWAALRQHYGAALIAWFSGGDFVWSLATTALVFFGGWITTREGAIATLLVAAAVGAMGVLQLQLRPSAVRSAAST